jgi:hypothetical protein
MHRTDQSSVDKNARKIVLVVWRKFFNISYTSTNSTEAMPFNAQQINERHAEG